MKGNFYTRFDLGKELGRGKYGVVKEAIDKTTGEVLAVKIVSKSKLGKVELESIKDEVKILQTMDHPNIIKCYGKYEDADNFYIATELARGGELFDRICKKQYYTESEAAKCIKTIAEALQYCNEKGVVHRDLKPENVLLQSMSDDTTIKLADFGFAKEIDPNGEGYELQTSCGTPGYIAPEILMRKPYGKEVDMWSLGVIAYVLLCGYTPFNHSNQSKLFKMIKKGEYQFDAEYWEGVSDDAKSFVAGLLVVDPSGRMTANEVLSHGWLQTQSERDITPVLTKLRGYQARRRLKKGVLAVQGAVFLQKGASQRISDISGETSGSENTVSNPAI